MSSKYPTRDCNPGPVFQSRDFGIGKRPGFRIRAPGIANPYTQLSGVTRRMLFYNRFVVYRHVIAVILAMDNISYDYHMLHANTYIKRIGKAAGDDNNDII
jgi:hypothetical protein